MVQNVQYSNIPPSHMTPFEYWTPIQMDIQVFGIQMVTVLNLIFDLNCSIFSTHMSGIQIRAKGRTEYGGSTWGTRPKHNSEGAQQ